MPQFDEKEYLNRKELSYEEVWLRAYIAAISLNHITSDVCQDIASDTLRRFKNTFRNNND